MTPQSLDTCALFERWLLFCKFFCTDLVVIGADCDCLHVGLITTCPYMLMPKHWPCDCRKLVETLDPDQKSKYYIASSLLCTRMIYQFGKYDHTTPNPSTMQWEWNYQYVKHITAVS